MNETTENYNNSSSNNVQEGFKNKKKDFKPKTYNKTYIKIIFPNVMIFFKFLEFKIFFFFD